MGACIVVVANKIHHSSYDHFPPTINTPPTPTNKYPRCIKEPMYIYIYIRAMFITRGWGPLLCRVNGLLCFQGSLSSLAQP